MKRVHYLGLLQRNELKVEQAIRNYLYHLELYLDSVNHRTEQYFLATLSRTDRE